MNGTSNHTLESIGADAEARIHREGIDSITDKEFAIVLHVATMRHLVVLRRWMQGVVVGIAAIGAAVGVPDITSSFPLAEEISAVGITGLAMILSNKVLSKGGK